MNNRANSLDRFLVRSLRAFLNSQVAMYHEDISAKPSPHPEWDEEQAKYEVAALAVATVLRMVSDRGETERLPVHLQRAMEAIDAEISAHGDLRLKQKGVPVPE